MAVLAKLTQFSHSFIIKETKVKKIQGCEQKR